MLYWLGYGLIVIVAATSGFAFGAYRPHVRRNVSMLGSLPVLAFTGYGAWLYAWQARCPGCPVGTEDSRETFFALAVIYLAFMLMIVLAALCGFAGIGYLARPRREGERGEA